MLAGLLEAVQGAKQREKQNEELSVRSDTSMCGAEK